MRHRLIQRKKNTSILQPNSVPLEEPLRLKHKSFFPRQIHWKLNKKAKCLIASAVIALVLVSFFAVLYLEDKPKADAAIITQKDNSTSTATPTSSPNSKSKSSGGSLSNLSGLINGISQAIQNAAGDQTKPQGIIESAQTINSTVWKQVAAAAWSFFQPGIGVDSNTGLPYGGGKSFPDLPIGI